MSTKRFRWNQPNDRVWIIETNTDKKYIKTIDEKGNIIVDQEDVSEGAIQFMIENFISVIAIEEKKNPIHEYDSMYA